MLVGKEKDGHFARCENGSTKEEGRRKREGRKKGEGSGLFSTGRWNQRLLIDRVVSRKMILGINSVEYEHRKYSEKKK